MEITIHAYWIGNYNTDLILTIKYCGIDALYALVIFCAGNDFFLHLKEDQIILLIPLCGDSNSRPRSWAVGGALPLS